MQIHVSKTVTFYECCGTFNNHCSLERPCASFMRFGRMLYVTQV
jgi:hypothetical protein